MHLMEPSSGNANQVVFGPRFMMPQPVDLVISRNIIGDMLSEGNFNVVDCKGNVVFKMQGKVLSIRNRRTLLDAGGNPIVTVRPVLLSMHDRWQAFKGDSVDEKDLIFTVKRSSMIQFKAKLYVTLAGNENNEEGCDYRVGGNWREKACKIYAGKSKKILAKMKKTFTLEGIAFGKDSFKVTVEPNVDYAFIIALIAILDGINNDDKDKD